MTIFAPLQIPAGLFVATRCVVSLHDFSLTTQLLELGVVPCGSSGRKRVFEDAIFRGTSQRYDTSAIHYIGTHQAPDYRAGRHGTGDRRLWPGSCSRN